jgi:hypothetical protein
MDLPKPVLNKFAQANELENLVKKLPLQIIRIHIGTIQREIRGNE